MEPVKVTITGDKSAITAEIIAQVRAMFPGAEVTIEPNVEPDPLDDPYRLARTFA